MFVCVNSFVMKVVSGPTYVKVVHFCFVWVLWGDW